MTKAKLALLEKAFAAEIRSAIEGGPYVMQTKSKLALELCDEGYLVEAEEALERVLVKGYALTQLGRMTYCQSCGDEDEEALRRRIRGGLGAE